MRRRQLEYFIAVAEELHFGRAAKRAHIEQPPLSRQIRALEDELGAKLLERTRRRVSLTPEGAFFLGEARAVVKRLRQAGETVRSMAAGDEGVLRLGFVTPVLHTTFAKAIRRFRTRRPKIRLTLKHEGTAEQLKMLRSGRIDMGFLRPYDHDLTGVEMRPFWSEPYILLMPEDHPLASLKAVPLEKLAGEPLILFPRHVCPPLHDTFTAAFNKAGFSPNIVQEVIESQATITLAASGMGLALMSRSVQNERRAGVAYRPVVGDLPLVRIHMGRMKDRSSPLLDHFMRHIEEYGQS